MARQLFIYLLINTLGGLAVLGSYYHGYSEVPDAFAALWGGVPETLKPLYTVSMFAAAAGYLTTFAYIVASGHRQLPMLQLNGLYAAILFCSALWLPLTVGVIASDYIALWWSTRAVLLVTGLCAAMVWWKLWQQQQSAPGAFLTLALLGQAAFCWQTLGLDALVWPYFFPI